MQASPSIQATPVSLEAPCKSAAGLQANGGASSYTDLLAEAPDMSNAAVDSNGNGAANGFGDHPQGSQFGGQQGGQFGGQYGAQQGPQYGQGGQFGGQQPTGQCWHPLQTNSTCEWPNSGLDDRVLKPCAV